MTNGLTIITTNQNVTKDGGYHEIHNIDFLNSPEHALETLKSVINLNLKYTPKDCPLINVLVECDNLETYKTLKSHYNKEKLKELYIDIRLPS